MEIFQSYVELPEGTLDVCEILKQLRGGKHPMILFGFQHVSSIHCISQDLLQTFAEATSYLHHQSLQERISSRWGSEDSLCDQAY